MINSRGLRAVHRPAMLTLVLLSATLAHAEEARRLSDLSLDELMNEPVTSVSKRETRRGDAATAITVITPEDIRRAGITALPEALRLVPGFDVARIDGSHWAISARGFNLQYANTLLVLVDGRSVYSPAFGGVYWDAELLPLDDLERIEVIRGPGAVIWGANAVNGVVNIITRNARNTQGVAVTAAAGTEDQPSVEARYGGTLGGAGAYRVYGSYSNRIGLDDLSGRSIYDDWHTAQAGFRADWDATADHLITVQGDYYSLRAQRLLKAPTLVPPFTRVDYGYEDAEGGNLLARWTQAFSDTSELTLQSYFDTYDRTSETRGTADFELVHRFRGIARNDVVWGAGYRHTRESLHLGENVVITPAQRSSALYTAFAQDEIALAEPLRLTLGVKLEHNEFTGLETQPNIRLLYAPSANQAAWAAVSRAVSTPSRFFTNSRYSVGASQDNPAAPVVEVALLGDPNIPSQRLTAFELGYRAQLSTALAFDVATFFNDYSRLYGLVPAPPAPDPQTFPHVAVPLTWQPVAAGRSYGAEIEMDWQPLAGWRLTSMYSWLHLRVDGNAPLGTGSPAHQLSLRSQTALSSQLDLTASLAYVDSIESLMTVTDTTHVPSYVRFDLGMQYRPTRTFEVGVWGQNLLGAHAENSSQDSGTVSEVPRGVLIKGTYRF